MSMGDYEIGALISAAVGRIPETITAGAGNDNTEVNGPPHDRNSLEALYSSVEVVFAWSATQDTAETLTLAANLQDSADASAWADFGSATSGPGGGSEIFASAVIDTGAAGTVNGVSRFGADIRSARRHLRLQSTFDLSRVGTDTVDVAAVLVFGGGSVLPAV